MAAQQKKGKTSNTQEEPHGTIRAGLGPEFRGRIYLFGFRPQNVNVIGDQISGTLPQNEPLAKSPY